MFYLFFLLHSSDKYTYSPGTYSIRNERAIDFRQPHDYQAKQIQ